MCWINCLGQTGRRPRANVPSPMRQCKALWGRDPFAKGSPPPRPHPLKPLLARSVWARRAGRGMGADWYGSGQPGVERGCSVRARRAGMGMGADQYLHGRVGMGRGCPVWEWTGRHGHGVVRCGHGGQVWEWADQYLHGRVGMGRAGQCGNGADWYGSGQPGVGRGCPVRARAGWQGRRAGPGGCRQRSPSILAAKLPH